MSVRVDGKTSKLRPVNAGAPQGTYTFNTGTDYLEEGFENTQQGETYYLHEGDLAFLEVASERGYAESTPIRQTPVNDPGLSPVQNNQDNFFLLPTALNIPSRLTNCIEPTWRKLSMTTYRMKNCT